VPWSSLPLPSSQRDLDRDLGLVITCSYSYLVIKKRSFDEKAKKDQIKDEKKPIFNGLTIEASRVGFRTEIPQNYVFSGVFL
jgi:hypothetical protein